MANISIYDYLDDDLLGVEKSQQSAFAQALRLAKTLRRPMVVYTPNKEAVCITPRGRKEYLPLDWAPPGASRSVPPAWYPAE